jgi:LPS-assembly lipoprotein
MSWADRRIFVLSLAALAGCGFAPVYGPSGAGTALHRRIAVDLIDSREGFVLTSRLEERLGRAEAPDFALAVTLATEVEALAISNTNEIGRFNIVGTADFTLRELAGGTRVFSDRVSSFTSYSATASTVGTLSAERDAYARLAGTLADMIVARLLASAARWAP